MASGLRGEEEDRLFTVGVLIYRKKALDFHLPKTNLSVSHSLGSRPRGGCNSETVSYKLWYLNQKKKGPDEGTG